MTISLSELIERRLQELENNAPEESCKQICLEVREALGMLDVGGRSVAFKVRFIAEAVVSILYRKHLSQEHPNLAAMIYALEQADVLTKTLAHDAHYIRLLGNDGVHVDKDDPLKTYPLSPRQAEQLILMSLVLVERLFEEYGWVNANKPFDKSSKLGVNPYKGLTSFGLEDSELFFGREKETAELLALTHESFIGITGASGSGKSSLAFAGLAAKLQQQDWVILDCRPRNQPFYELAHTLVSALYPDTEITRNKIENVAEGLLSQELALNSLLQEIRGDKPGIVLLIDQFEELFTQPENRHVFSQYCACINRAVIENPGQILIVITLRADFLASALENQQLAQLLDRYPTKMLGAVTDLYAIAEKPAKARGVVFESLLVERLLNDLQQREQENEFTFSVNLPLLQFTLEQLWDAQEEGYITHRSYGKLGGIRQALSHKAEEFYANLTAEDQQRMRRIFVQLVRPGLVTNDNRQVATRKQIGANNWSMISQLADVRLVITNLDKVSQQETVEIVHETLVQHWQRLSGWIDVHRDFMVWQAKLRQYLADWQASAKDERALLFGIRLAEAEEYFNKDATLLSDEEQKFITKSRAHANKLLEQEQSRQREIQAALTAKVQASQQLAKRSKLFAGFALSAVIITSWKWWESNQQREHVEQQNILISEVMDRLIFELPQQLVDVPGTAKVLENLLDDNLNSLDHMAKSGGDERYIEQQKMVNKMSRAIVYVKLGDFAKFQEIFKEAKLDAQTFIDRFKHDLDEDKRENLTVMWPALLAGLEKNQSELDLARGHYLQSLTLQEKRLKKDPDNDEWSADLANTYKDLGSLEAATDQIEKAKRYFEQALSLIIPLHEKNKGNDEWSSVLADTYQELADLELEAGQLDQARPNLNNAMRLRKQLLEKHPDVFQRSIDFANIHYSLARLEKELGQIDQARNYLNKTIEIVKPLQEKEPDNVSTLLVLAAAYGELGNIGRNAGRTEEGRGYWLEALNIYRQLYKNNEKTDFIMVGLAEILSNLGLLAYETGQINLTRSYYTEALELTNQLHQQNRDDNSRISMLALLYRRFGDLDSGESQPTKARENYVQALSFYQQLQERERDNLHWVKKVSQVSNDLGLLERDLNQTSDAREHFALALNLYKQLQKQESDNPDWAKYAAWTLHDLGGLERDANQPTIAREYYAEAMALYQQILAGERDNFFWVSSIADVLADSGRLESRVNLSTEARQHFTQALALFKQLQKQQPDDLKWVTKASWILNDLGHLERDLNQPTAAREFYTEALKLCKPLHEQHPDNLGLAEGVAVAMHNLGLLEMNLNQTELARDYFLKAIAVRNELHKQGYEDEALLANLAGTFYLLGVLETRVNQTDKAREYFAQSQALNERLQEREPYNPEWTNNVAVIQGNLYNLQADIKQIDTTITKINPPRSIAERENTLDARALINNLSGNKSENVETLSALRKIPH